MRLVAVVRKRLAQSFVPNARAPLVFPALLRQLLQQSQQRRRWRTPIALTHISAQPYSSSSSSAIGARNPKDKKVPPSLSVDNDSIGTDTITIMSAQEFHRRHATRSNGPAPSFDPSASAFVPLSQVSSLPMKPPPPAGWQPQSGHNVPQTDNDEMQLGSARGDAGDESDASTSPSVGEPLAQFSQRRVQTETIPVLGKSKANKKKSKVKVKEKKRPYLVPSKASGGVPDPTKEYIARSAQAPSLLPAPRQILVIIDLNGTLLHRPNHRKTSTFVERPFTRTFLDYCLRTFIVAIWSSAKPMNVEKMVPQILTPEDQQKLVAVWGRDTIGLSKEDYDQRVQVYKRLERVWDSPRVMSSHPEAHFGQRWDQTNTVLIDDSKEKARSQPYNLIQLPEFEGNVEEAGFVLPQVHNYLNECAFQRDISSFIRENPFKFDPSFSLDAQRKQISTINE